MTGTRMTDDQNRKIAETAKISKGTILGYGVIVWDFCNLIDCHIGNAVSIGAYTEIGKGVVVGMQSRIQARVFIPQGVRIGQNVFIGPGVIFTNDKRPMAQNPNFISQATYVEDNVSIGAGAIILPQITLGEGCMVGAGAVVTKNVRPHTTVIGNPAHEI